MSFAIFSLQQTESDFLANICYASGKLTGVDHKTTSVWKHVKSVEIHSPTSSAPSHAHFSQMTHESFMT